MQGEKDTLRRFPICLEEKENKKKKKRKTGRTEDTLDALDLKKFIPTRCVS
jgi:hypothetical protein